jgi:predicted RNA-binding protein Jag
VTQIKEALVRIVGPNRRDDASTEALSEALDAIRAVKATLRPRELSPQNAFVRRLQHQLVAEHQLVARSTGKEPQRRLRISPGPDVE